MFTGIIETTALITEISTAGSNKSFWLQSPLANELKIDQSLSHNGVCLTIEAIVDNQYKVTAIDETLKKTTADLWQIGQLVNIERCLPVNGRIDGHFVQGHVDATGIIISIQPKEGSYEYQVEFDEKFAALVIEKGSIALDGISLTVFNITSNSFTVAIIPYTYEYTHIKNLVPGNKVNLEFDVLGKYLNRLMELQLSR